MKRALTDSSAVVVLADEKHPSELLSALAEHRRAGTFCDVNVAVGEVGGQSKTFAAHRVVLSAGSGYMRGLFRSATADSAAPTIELVDMAAATFAVVLDFLYTGRCCLEDESQLGALLAAAARLQVTPLLRAAADAIQARLAPENSLAWWAAAESLALPALLNAARLAALRGFEAAVADDDALAAASQPQLLELISDRKLATPHGEEVVHATVARWVRLHPAATEEEVLALFGGVRFALLGREFVKTTVNEEPLLQTGAGSRLVRDALQRSTFGEAPPRRLGFGPEVDEAAPLVAHLLGGTKEQKASALSAVRKLARRSDDDKLAIACVGGIEPLVALARDGTDGQKESAAAALRSLAMNADNKSAIARAGGIEPLVALARDGTDGQKEEAAGALRNLAVNADNQLAIARAGGIEPLVALARDGTDRQKEWAAGALRNLALDAGNQLAIARAGGADFV